MPKQKVRCSDRQLPCDPTIRLALARLSEINIEDVESLGLIEELSRLWTGDRTALGGLTEVHVINNLKRAPLKMMRRVLDSGALQRDSMGNKYCAVGDDFLARYDELRSLFVGRPLGSDVETSLRQLYRFLAFCETIHEQFKYVTNVVFNTMMGELELPELKPHFLDPKDLFDSAFTFRFKTSRTNRKLYLANTLLQGFKKGLLPLPLSKAAGSVAEQKHTLGSEPPEMTRHTRTLISRLVKTIHSSSTWRNKAHSGVHWNGSVSTHATIDCSRGARGNLGELLCREHGVEGRDAKAVQSATFLHVLTEKVPKAVGEFAFTHRDDGVTPSTEYQSEEIIVTDRILVDELLQKHVVEADFVERKPTVKPFVLAEPLKSRMISIPGTLDYAPLVSLQKLLWELMQDPIFEGRFQLTGKPVSEETIQSLWDDTQEHRFYGDFGLQVANSGDYRGATDRISGTVGRLFVEELLEPLKADNPTLVDWAVKSLFETRVLSSGAKFSGTDPVFGLTGKKLQEFWEQLLAEAGASDFEQKTGQLMGHVLSFPILCFINYLAYHESWERSLCMKLSVGRSRDWLRPPPCLVNGDDILFFTNDLHRTTWEETLGGYGFFKSIGKNFYNRQFCLINSALFKRVEWNVVDGTRWQKVGYASFAVVTGRGKAKDCTVNIERTSYDESVETLDVIQECFRSRRKTVEDGEKDPFAMMISNLPDLLWAQMKESSAHLRDRLLGLWVKHLKGLRGVLRFLPWVSLLRSIRSSDLELFEFYRRSFRLFSAPRELEEGPRIRGGRLIEKMLESETFGQAYFRVKRTLSRKRKVAEKDLPLLIWLLQRDSLCVEEVQESTIILPTPKIFG